MSGFLPGAPHELPDGTMVSVWYGEGDPNMKGRGPRCGFSLWASIDGGPWLRCAAGWRYCKHADVSEILRLVSGRRELMDALEIE